MSKRKVIQMFFTTQEVDAGYDESVMVVLCDDGTMWTMLGSLSLSASDDWKEMIGPEENDSAADRKVARPNPVEVF